MAAWGLKASLRGAVMAVPSVGVRVGGAAEVGILEHQEIPFSRMILRSRDDASARHDKPSKMVPHIRENTRGCCCDGGPPDVQRCSSTKTHLDCTSSCSLTTQDDRNQSTGNLALAGRAYQRWGSININIGPYTDAHPPRRTFTVKSFYAMSRMNQWDAQKTNTKAPGSPSYRVATLFSNNNELAVHANRQKYTRKNQDGTSAHPPDVHLHYCFTTAIATPAPGK